MTYSIVIPLYNEEVCVKQSIVEIVDSLDREFANAYELILVINGSQDRTGEICESLAAHYPCIKIVWTQRNLGYGGGIILGIEGASGDYIGFMCGDGQVSPQDLLRVMREMRLGTSDLVKASRIARRDGLIRKVNSLCYNSVFAILFGTNSRDINAMPKFWRREVSQLLDLTSRDWFIDAEIMIKARYQGLRVQEIPIEYLERIGGRSRVRIGTVFEFLRNALVLIISGRLQSWRRPPIPSRST